MISWSKRIGWLLAVLGLVLLLVWGGRLARTALSLREHLDRLQELASAPQELDPAAACALVLDLREDVAGLEREAGGLVGLAPALGWLPGVGGDLRAAPALLEVAGGLTEAGALACDALEPAVTALGDDAGTLSLERVASLLDERYPDLERALAAAERAEAAWAQVDRARLSPWLAGKTALLEQGLPLLRAALTGATAAPDLLGMDGPRVYLVLAVNEDEVRPGGGYITGVGEVRVEGGRLVALTFRDSSEVDDFTQPYPDPPEPLRRYMGIELWLFRDAAWSPDFPTVARQAVSLYRPGYPVAVDGVIAVDQQAVQALVESLGPLEVEGAEEPITGGTVVAYMRRAWAPEDGALTGEWFVQRKAFMGALAQAIVARLEGGAVDWSLLLQALVRLLDEKHLLLYLSQPDVETLLIEQGWAGALQPGTGDFLMVVDANVGYNKASVLVQESLLYQVDLRDSPPLATLTLVYTHTSTMQYPCRPEVRYDPVYEQMMDRCYWDYVQLYVPRGSQLVSATQLPVPAESLFSGQAEAGEVAVGLATEGPWTTFGVLALLPPSSSQTRVFTWTLPANVVEWGEREGRYALRVPKQPGTPHRPLTLRVRLPEGSRLLESMPAPVAVDGEWVVYRTTLDRDRTLWLRFDE